MSKPTIKNKYWVGVLYPENMIDGWELVIGDVLELPYAYCIHNKDKDKQSAERKTHVHLIIVFPNTTTYNHALEVFNKLSAEGEQAINTCQPVINIRHKYNYLIHDTDTCRKQKKFLYSPDDRVTGNNFDIGIYEQLDMQVKNDMCRELCNIIMQQGFYNFGDFYIYVITHFEDSNYFEILKSYSGLFERLTKSNYQKWQIQREQQKSRE